MAKITTADCKAFLVECAKNGHFKDEIGKVTPVLSKEDWIKQEMLDYPDKAAEWSGNPIPEVYGTQQVILMTPSGNRNGGYQKYLKHAAKPANTPEAIQADQDEQYDWYLEEINHENNRSTEIAVDLQDVKQWVREGKMTLAKFMEYECLKETDTPHDMWDPCPFTLSEVKCVRGFGLNYEKYDSAIRVNVYELKDGRLIAGENNGD